jgi:hypothetical protein
MTFLLSEDKAVRQWLQGMTVTDQKAEGDEFPRQVGVWFGQPDQELRNQVYPYITIDMIDINRDPSREMRGVTSAAYLEPEGIDPETESFEVDIPIPVNLDYQITTYCRHPRHDRELLAALLHRKLQFRFGVLEVETGKVDEDDNPMTTLRRLDVMDVAKRDVTEQAKRLFVNAITVRVSSEIPQGVFYRVYKALEINLHNPDPSRAGGTDRYPYFLGTGEQVIVPPPVTP